jgi:uncharacterized membrane protein
MKKAFRDIWLDVVIAVIMIVIVAALWIFNIQHPITYSMYTGDAISYSKGTVVHITSENLEQVKDDRSRYIGTQKIVVKMREGEFKGNEISISNDLSTTHNVRAGVGQNLVIKVDHPKNTTPFFTVYNYDRTPGILLIVFLFAVFMIIVGRAKGLKSVIGLAFTLFFILTFLLPMIYHGFSPILSCVVTILVTVTLSMLLLNGFSSKTVVAIISTMLGVLISAAFYTLFSAVLHLSGYSLSESEELVLIHQSTGLQINQILFVGILIASFGAVMDMTMSVASSLYEMKHVHPAMTSMEVIQSGMEIGKDMIGTMCETLILAFTGTGISTLLVIISYGTQFDQLLSSDYIAVEVIHSITGGMAVILSVPITAVLSAGFFARAASKK